MLRYIISILFIITILPSVVLAGKFSTIRDDEIETYLSTLANPVFRAAGLNENNIRIYIVNSPVLNAWVSGGQNLFLNTGLILESDDPSLLIGVIAHEVGHIAGAHLLRKGENMKLAGKGAVIGYLLGIASVALGAPSGAAAVLASGGSHIAERSFLKYSRAHEEAADQAALSFLKKVNVSPRGLMDLLSTLNSEQNLLMDNINPYRMSHPLSSERISHIRNTIETSPNLDKKTPEKLIEKHHRITAKLRAFLEPPKEIFSDNFDVASRYAKAISLYRIPMLEKSIEVIDSLIMDFPKDPYFHELKGQILFENGRIDDAIPDYEKAAELLPKSPLIKMGLAIAQLAKDEEEFTNAAIKNLKFVLIKEGDNIFAWRQLGIAYGRKNKLDKSYLALAEASVLMGEKEEAKKYIKLGEKYGKENPKSLLHAKDLLKVLENSE